MKCYVDKSTDAVKTLVDVTSLKWEGDWDPERLSRGSGAQAKAWRMS